VSKLCISAFGASEVWVSAVRSRDTRKEKWRSAESLGMRDTWQNLKVGPWNRQADTRCSLKGVNTPLTSHVSGFRKIRGRKSNLLTCEVAKGEKS
jgi:hypothetical protein